jgi:hypothetical protein
MVWSMFFSKKKTSGRKASARSLSITRRAFYAFDVSNMLEEAHDVGRRCYLFRGKRRPRIVQLTLSQLSLLVVSFAYRAHKLIFPVTRANVVHLHRRAELLEPGRQASYNHSSADRTPESDSQCVDLFAPNRPIRLRWPNFQRHFSTDSPAWCPGLGPRCFFFLAARSAHLHVRFPYR